MQSKKTNSRKTKKQMIDIKTIRKDFPILGQEVYGKPLIYFDNAATTQKPQIVLDTIVGNYSTQNANIYLYLIFNIQEHCAYVICVGRRIILILK